MKLKEITLERNGSDFYIMNSVVNNKTDQTAEKLLYDLSTVLLEIYTMVTKKDDEE
ncbi:MAG: hypothetical protein K5695_08065 [Oscillospiraceae bacterium]|nr:hypothetical protein [Oscillospiraceae bacterium]